MRLPKTEYLLSKQEVFAALFLDAKHHLIQYVEMFRGTIDSASVYPREVVKEAPRLNAAAVIFSHNHPSGHPEPSQADKILTQRLKEVLALVEVRSLDHVIVAGQRTVSFVLCRARAALITGGFGPLFAAPMRLRW